METLNNLFLSADKIATNDYVGFTFFVGCMAMMAASAFLLVLNFFLIRREDVNLYQV